MWKRLGTPYLLFFFVWHDFLHFPFFLSLWLSGVDRIGLEGRTWSRYVTITITKNYHRLTIFFLSAFNPIGTPRVEIQIQTNKKNHELNFLDFWTPIL